MSDEQRTEDKTEVEAEVEAQRKRTATAEPQDEAASEDDFEAHRKRA
jgi:hypothetical protein